MRIITAARSVVPMLLSVALYTAPSTARAADPVRTIASKDADAKSAAGLYSLTVRGKDADQRIDLVLDQVTNGYTGRLVTYDQDVALENITVDGEFIRATARTNFGKSDVILRVTSKGIVGTMRVAKVTLNVSGERVY